jgi:hypothetical protein
MTKQFQQLKAEQRKESDVSELVQAFDGAHNMARNIIKQLRNIYETYVQMKSSSDQE